MRYKYGSKSCHYMSHYMKIILKFCTIQTSYLWRANGVGRIPLNLISARNTALLKIYLEGEGVGPYDCHEEREFHSSKKRVKWI